MDAVLILLVILIAAGVAIFWAIKSVHRDDVWAIGVYWGSDPVTLTPHPATRSQAVLSANDVTDAKALFVADPFLVRTPEQWLMFFEVLNCESNRGEIAYASSHDGVNWRYERIVLRERFHLSYPQVFRYGDAYYMIPETAEAGSVRLYRAQSFPGNWTLVAELLQGHYLDSTILYWNDRWWLFALRDNSVLSLHFAPEITGPWTEHPLSPVAHEQHTVRPAGRIVAMQGRLVRFSQDGASTYGYRVYAAEILELTQYTYAERQISTKPVICASGNGWNAHGMHHTDTQHLQGATWIAAVDGKYIRRRFVWRKGVRAILNCLGVPNRRQSASGQCGHSSMAQSKIRN